MKTIGIIANRDKDIDLKYTKILVESALGKGANIKISWDMAMEIGLEAEKIDEDEVFKTSDVIICLGGDGTFLRAARKAYKYNTLLMGVNLGTLGFLVGIDKQDIDSAISNFIENKYAIEERMMLEFKIIRDGNIIASDVALNDIVISRGALSRILNLKAYFSDILVDYFPGDGLIISSPTGSTAYSLSAGGPIVEPNSDMIIVTPICPHMVYSHSFVTTGNSLVKVKIDEKDSYVALVTADGQNGYETLGGDIVEIKKSEYKVKMIKMSSKSFFSILRDKIHVRGENIKKDEI